MSWKDLTDVLQLYYRVIMLNKSKERVNKMQIKRNKRTGNIIITKYLLKEIRTQKLLTIRELSKKSGISQKDIKEIENNLKKPDIQILLKIAESLDVNEKSLYEIIKVIFI